MQQLGAWIDRAADPNRRLLRWIGLVVAVVAALGLMAGAIKHVLGGDDHEANQRPSDRWISDDGAPPERLPADNETGFLGLGLGAPVASVEDLLGRPTEVIDDQSDSGDGTVQYWDRDGLRFSFRVNDVGALTHMSVSWATGSTKRIGLPHKLVLGQSTLAEVLATYGPPVDVGWTAAENAAFYVFQWRDGPEATEYVAFTLLIEGGAGDAPLDDVNSLCESVMTTYELSYVPTSDIEALETPRCGRD